MSIPSKPYLITDFSDFSHQQWRIVNDSVMGGKSQGQFQINSEGHAVFLGNVSLENNGGFTMVKNHESLNLSGYSKILLKVSGDGKKYSFRLQTGESPNNIHPWSYECRFTSPNEKSAEVILNLSDFEPVYRGRTPENAPPLDQSKIYRYAFLISDKQEGNFRLKIESVKALV